MAEDGNSLDAFITSEESTSLQNQTKETSNTEIDLEAEFAKLLNDFVTPTTVQRTDSEKEEKKNTNTETGGLDSFITTSSSTNQPKQNEGLDSFVTETKPVSQNEEGGLDNLITDNVVTEQEDIEENDKLKPEERELALAISSFQESMYALADEKNYKVPDTDYTEDLLIPNYKPSVGKKIAQYLLACWDIINKCDPESMKRLSKDAGDEEYLSFAETLSNVNMQGAIVSYVQILINIEICEVSYEQKKEIIQKNRIKRELYEEYMELQERKALFIEKLKEKNFPIDATRLINNYFRVAQKDADGAFDALTKNPAMFSPIEIEKIKPKFFGLIKVTPEDGIKMNQKIGKFIKKLKV